MSIISRELGLGYLQSEVVQLVVQIVWALECYPLSTNCLEFFFSHLPICSICRLVYLHRVEEDGVVGVIRSHNQMYSTE